MDKNTDFTTFVQLPDYNHIKISYNEIEMTESELNTSMIIDMQMNDVPIDINEDNVTSQINDDVTMKYFNLNKKDYMEQLKSRIEKARKWDFIYQYILENTSFSYLPDSNKTYCQQVLATCKEKAKKDNKSLDKYLEAYFQMNQEDFNDYALEVYKEILVFYAIAQKEGLSYSEDEYKEKISELIQEGIVFEEDLNIFGKEYGYSQVIAAELQEILTDKIKYK